VRARRADTDLEQIENAHIHVWTISVIILILFI